MKCVSVLVEQYPDRLKWVYENGQEELTTDLSLATRIGCNSIARRADHLGLGCRREIARFLRFARGVEFVEQILPLNYTGFKR